jgi:hypothetical protein
MRKALFTLLVLLFGCSAFSQSMPPIDHVTLETKEDYRLVEPLVLQVSGYLLANPVDKNDEVRLNASVFLVRWMANTPDYTFSFEHSVTKYFEKDVNLVGIYYAAACASAIQNKQATDQKSITLNAIKKFVAYINDPGNHVVITSRLKKLSEADQNGKLESFLKL